MRRSGTVADLNRDRGMVAIATDDGYTIIEVDASCSIGIGDEMAWEQGLHIGPAIYENLTRRWRDGVFVRAHGVGADELAHHLLR